MRLIRALIGDGNRVFSVDSVRELATSAGMSSGYLRQALHHLTNAGWLVRLRKGLYTLSTTAPGVQAPFMTPLARIGFEHINIHTSNTIRRLIDHPKHKGSPP